METITLIVDAAFGMDYYGILIVKNQKKIINYSSVEDCRNVLIAQLGMKRFQEIVASKEFKEVCDVNSLTFDSVEKADKGEMTAQEVHQINKLRYRAKQALQKKFFGGEMKIEIKSDRAK